MSNGALIVTDRIASDARAIQNGFTTICCYQCMQNEYFPFNQKGKIAYSDKKLS